MDQTPSCSPFYAKFVWSNKVHLLCSVKPNNRTLINLRGPLRYSSLLSLVLLLLMSFLLPPSISSFNSLLHIFDSSLAMINQRWDSNGFSSYEKKDTYGVFISLICLNILNPVYFLVRVKSSHQAFFRLYCKTQLSI